jgi:hypothetical protein
MHALRGGRGNHQIPSGFENPVRTQCLPEGDIELAPRRPAPHQSSHDHALAHRFIIPCPFLHWSESMQLDFLKGSVLDVKEKLA